MSGLSPWRCAFVGVAAWLLESISGPAADAPALAKQLEAPDKDIRREACFQLEKLGPAAQPALPALLKVLNDPDKQVWSEALAAIASMGPAAAEATGSLIDSMGANPGGRQYDRQQTLVRAAFALSQIGACAVPALGAALEGESAPRRLGAAIALGNLGPVAKEAVPGLVKNLSYGDENVRTAAIEALGQIGEPAVAALVAALQDAEARRRAGAALALARMDPAPHLAGAALLARAQEEKDDTVLAALYLALPRAGVEPEKVAGMLIEAARSENAALRHAAVNGLLSSPAVAEKAMPSLTQDLSHAEAGRRKQAAIILGRFGPRARQAVPALLEHARAEAAEPAFSTALAQIGPGALPALLEQLAAAKGPVEEQAWIFRALSEMGTPALSALSESLRSPSASVRAGAASALAGLPLEKSPAVKTLLELTADKEPAVRAAALHALAGVRSQSAAVVPKLEAGVDDADPAVRRASAAGLASLGATGKLGLNGLLSLLDDPDRTTQEGAIRALGAMGKAAAPAVPALLLRLKTADFRGVSIETLGQIGPAASAAAPALVEMARQGDDGVRSAVFPAMAGIGPACSAALPLLYQAARGGNRELEPVALNALTKVETDDSRLLPLAVEALKNESRRMRRIGAKEAKRIGEQAQPAVAPLVALLDRETDRPEALDALRSIHPRDVGLLTALLKHKEPAIRLYACDALAFLGHDAKDAVPALLEKTEGDNDKVRDAAKKALAKIQGA